MAFYSEQTVSKLLHEGYLAGGKLYTVQGDIFTPSARELLQTNHIEVVQQKQEHITDLRDGVQVIKTHPRIVLRGKIDRLESEMIYTQCCFPALKAVLQELIDFIRKALRQEVKNEPFTDWTLLGLTPQELREHSHHVKANYDMPHFMPSAEYGKAVAAVNRLRTLARETELAVVAAFPDSRTDLNMAFNRLSSALYIVMVKCRRGDYGQLD